MKTRNKFLLIACGILTGALLSLSPIIFSAANPCTPQQGCTGISNNNANTVTVTTPMVFPDNINLQYAYDHDQYYPDAGIYLPNDFTAEFCVYGYSGQGVCLTNDETVVAWNGYYWRSISDDNWFRLGTGTSNSNNTVAQLYSIQKGAVWYPAMTTLQRDAIPDISNAPQGFGIFNTDQQTINFWNKTDSVFENVATLSASSTVNHLPIFSNSSGKLTDSGIPVSGSSISANLNGTATNANNAITSVVSTDVDYYLTFVSAANNVYQVSRVNSNLKYNPFTSTVTATNFAGNATSATSSTTATTATNANNIATTSASTNADFPITFVASNASSNQAVRTNSTLTYNPSSTLLKSDSIQLRNGGAIFAPNSTGTQQIFAYPRFTDNRTYLYIGTAGALFRQNDQATTWMDVATNNDITFPGRLFGGATQTQNVTGALNIRGTNATINNSANWFTPTDQYGIFQILPYSHNNASLLFDAAYNGTNWISSTSLSNFKISKGPSDFLIDYASGITAGSTITWSTGLDLDATGNITMPNGNLTFGSVGKTLSIKAGANACTGTSTLVLGTVTVNTTCAKTGDVILVSRTSNAGVTGTIAITAIVNNTSFTATSSSALDTSAFSYIIMHTN